MFSDDENENAERVRAIAIRIYVQLIAEQVKVTADGVKISTNPDNLAKISIKLAETFDKVEQGLANARVPEAQEFDLSKLDFGFRD